MTADADAPARAGRRGRSPFELLRFSATPVPGALVVVEIEGRVAAGSGRFARRPVLVVEPGERRPRLELAPSRSTLDGDRWEAAYAIPAEAYDAARFALGLRGTLLDLPAPDEPSASDRQTLLAREANALRRRLEAAEDAAEAARAEATAAAGELGAAVSAARDGAHAESAERIAALEREVAEARRVAASDAVEARTAHEEALAAKDRALEEAAARAEAMRVEAAAAHAQALAAKDRALEDAVARHDAALAEQRAAHEAALDAKEREWAQEAEARDAGVAGLRARDEEGAVDQEERRSVADAQARALIAEEGIGVLRAELAEERERFQGRIEELEQELVAATNRLEALRRAAEADAPATAEAARIADLEEQLAAATARADALRRAAEEETRAARPAPGLWAGAPGDDDPDRTRALAPVDGGDDSTQALAPVDGGDDEPTRALAPVDDDPDRTSVLDAGAVARSRPRPAAGARGAADAGAPADDTQPFTAKDEREAAGEPVLPLERGALPREARGRGVGAYVAVGALVAFVFVLLVLLGFLS